MNEYTADAFVNRDDPIPVITFDRNDEQSDENDSNAEDGQRHRLLSKTKFFKGKVQQSKEKASDGRRSMQDRLMEKY